MRKFHDNPVIKRGIDETLRELQRKVPVAFGNMIASRLGLEKNGYVQCGKLSPLHFRNIYTVFTFLISSSGELFWKNNCYLLA